MKNKKKNYNYLAWLESTSPPGTRRDGKVPIRITEISKNQKRKCGRDQRPKILKDGFYEFSDGSQYRMLSHGQMVRVKNKGRD